MKTTIHCGGISINGEILERCEKKIAKIEALLSSYLEEANVLPEVVKECEISLVFADSDGIAEINEEYRDSGGATDVLSFPMWENDEGAFEPPDDWERLTLGDIIVCPEIVAKNAAENGKDVESETVLVICHGFLHLIGLDHADELSRERMWKVQDALVARYFKED